MSLKNYKGNTGLELTSEKWLRNHFLAKIPRRIQQITQLPIQAGDKILDVCCGPGHYAEYFAQMVGVTGRVHAIDNDSTLIEAAESRRPYIITGENLMYLHTDATQNELPHAITSERYDVITFFNCLSYFEDPIKAIENYASLLQPEGRIILKDSDMGHIIVTPADSQLLHRIIEAAQVGPPLSFDNFLGRHLPAIASQIGARDVQIQVWSYPMYAPLSDAEKTYASVNLMTLMQQGIENLNPEDIQQWTEYFSADNLDALIHQDNFFFLMHEIVAIISIQSVIRQL